MAKRSPMMSSLCGVLLTILAACQSPLQPQPPVPWSDQLAIAEEAAHQRGADFELDDISADGTNSIYLDSNNPPAGSLVVNFEYVRTTPSPDGSHEVILVTLTDISPERFVQVKDFGQVVIDTYPPITPFIGQIKVSPRAVLEATRAEGEAFLGFPVPADSRDFSIRLVRGDQDPNSVGVPVAWTINYDKRDPAGEISTLQLWVDVQTGVILKLETK